MGELVADRAAGGVTVNDGVIDLGIVDAGQDEGGGGQDDLVVGRVVVGVVGLRRHLPFGAIDRFAQLRDVVFGLPDVAADAIHQVRSAVDLVGRVIAPM